jgi:hypothetical protein
MQYMGTDRLTGGEQAFSVAPVKASLVIFSARESPAVLLGTVRAALAASEGLSLCCDVVVNGTDPFLAEALVEHLGQHPDVPDGVTLRIHHILVPDKAWAWNAYVHQLWPACGLAYFVDGYAQVERGALASLELGLGDDPAVLGATGVPSVGRSAVALREAMLREGGIHGNLYCLRGEVLSRFRSTGFRLPLGLYRTDAAIAGVVNFNLDPASYSWDSRRIFVDPDATWRFEPLRVVRMADLRAHWSRMVRQAQGALENLAIKQHLQFDKRLPQDLPATAYDLVTEWMDRFPEQARRLCCDRPLARLARRRMRPWEGPMPPEEVPAPLAVFS